MLAFHRHLLTLLRYLLHQIDSSGDLALVCIDSKTALGVDIELVLVTGKQLVHRHLSLLLFHRSSSGYIDFDRNSLGRLFQSFLLGFVFVAGVNHALEVLLVDGLGRGERLSEAGALCRQSELHNVIDGVEN